MSDAESTAPKRTGRPATGVTPKRQVRIGAEWDEAERLALELARANGTVKLVKNRETGEHEEKGDLAGYIEEALRREHARVSRLLAREAPTS